MSDDIRITWTIEDDNADGYRVARSRDGGSTWTQAADLSPGTTQYDDTGLLDGEEYVHRVEAYTEDATAESGVTAPVTTTLPDAAGLQFDASVEDELTATWDDTIDYGSYRLQVRETGEGQAWGAVDEAVLGQDTTQYVIANLTDGEEYDVRLRTEAEHVEGAWLTLSPITLLPAPTGFEATTPAATSGASTIPTSWTDNSDNPDETWRVYYSTDGGQTWTEYAAGPFAANTTSVDVSGLEYSTTHTLKTRVETPHVYADSGTDTATTAYEHHEGLWLGWERPDGTRRDTPHVIEAATDYEHTAMHGGNPVVPAREVTTDDVFAEIHIFAGDRPLLRGEIEAVKPDSPAAGEATLKLRGPALALTRSGPDENVSYSNTPYHEAIQDYCSNQAGTPIDATVHRPPESVKTDGREVTNLGFDGTDFYSVGDDVPLEVTPSVIRALQTSYTGVLDDWTGTWTLVTSDNEYPGEYYISFEAAEVSALNGIFYSMTPAYDIPADRVGIRVHFAGFDGSGETSDVTTTFNGNDLGFQLGTGWVTFDDGYSGGDLSAGTDYEFEFSIEGGTSLTARIDAVTIYDKDYPPTVWGEATDITGQVDGPAHFPQDQELLFDNYRRTWALTDARVESTWNDTSNGQAIELSPNDGADYLSFANQTDVTADFESNDLYGDVLQPRVTLSAFGTTGWLTQRAQGQEITAFDVFVTTTDLPTIGAEPVELADSDFANLRTLHDDPGLMFVTDPVADGVTIESFARGDPAVERQLDARLLDVPEPNRDARGYGNHVSVKWRETEDGVLRSFDVRDFDEVDRVGEAIPKPPVFADVETTDGARNKARNELQNAVANDEVGGTIQAVADVILPGYPYVGIDRWPDGSYTLTRTSFRERADSAEASLKFVSDDDMVARLVETQRQVRENEKSG